MSVLSSPTGTSQAILRDGTTVEVRPVRPGDREALLSSVESMSRQSLARRFFAPKAHFSEKEIAYFVNVDQRDHVALVAITGGPLPRIAGGGRYVVIEPGRAELACAVVDEYQGHGLGRILLDALVERAKEAGLRELIAEVLPDNVPMLRLLQRLDLPMRTQRQRDATHVVIELAG